MVKEENNSKLTGRERFELDSFAYMDLARKDSKLQHPSADIFYGERMGLEGDPIIQTTLIRSQSAKQKEQVRKDIEAIKKGEALTPNGKEYKKLSEKEKDGLENLYNKSTVSDNETEAANLLGQAIELYSRKFQGGVYKLTANEAINYFSNKEGKLPVSVPKEVITAIKSAGEERVGNLEQESKEFVALELIKDFKVMGQTHNAVMRRITERGLASLVQDESEED